MSESDYTSHTQQGYTRSKRAIWSPRSRCSLKPVQRKSGRGGGPSPGMLQTMRQVDALREQLQLKSSSRAGGDSTSQIHQAAQEGVSGAASSLPHLEAIQRSFGHHDVSAVRAHVGGKAALASAQMGAEAYATGNDVAFGQQPSLHTAAHEAAHVVQQRSGKVRLDGGVGQVGDAYEQHADQVADAVVGGKSAQELLDAFTGHQVEGGSHVQRRTVQMEQDNKSSKETTDSSSESEEEDKNYKPVVISNVEHKESLLGSTNSITLITTNEFDAPEGTTFKWALPQGGDVVHWAGAPDVSMASPTFEAKCLRPGSVALSFELVVTDGQGKEMDRVEHEVSWSVLEPTINCFYTHMSPDKLPTNQDLRTGDLVQADVYIENVDFDGVGAGVDLVSDISPSLSLAESSDKLGPTTHIILKAEELGTVTPRLTIPFDEGMGHDVVMEPISVELSKGEFIASCGVAKGTITAILDQKEAAFQIGGIAYAQAWKNHTKVIAAEKQAHKAGDELAALATDLIFNAIITFVVGGTAGMIAAAMKKAQRPVFEVDAIKDLSKFGMKKGIKSGANAFPSAGLDASGGAGLSPMEWKVGAIKRVASEKSAAHSIVDTWVDAARDNEADFIMDFDPIEVTEEIMSKEKITVPGNADPIVVEFEKALWKKWLQQSAWVRNPVKPEDVHHQYWHEPKYKKFAGDIIRSRLNELGVDGGKWIEVEGNKSLERLKDIDRKKIEKLINKQ